MGEVDIKLELERLRSDIKNLNTVVKMSLDEQKSLNLRYENNQDSIDKRMGRSESKLWWIQGIIGSTGVALAVMIMRLVMMVK